MEDYVNPPDQRCPFEQKGRAGVIGRSSKFIQILNRRMAFREGQLGFCSRKSLFQLKIINLHLKEP